MGMLSDCDDGVVGMVVLGFVDVVVLFVGFFCVGIRVSRNRLDIRKVMYEIKIVSMLGFKVGVLILLVVWVGWKIILVIVVQCMVEMVRVMMVVDISRGGCCLSLNKSYKESLVVLKVIRKLVSMQVGL